MTQLENKIVLLTGATGGLGRAMCEAFVGKNKARLILSDIDGAPLDELAARYKDSVLGVFRADLSTEAGCARAHNAALEISAQVDILINNAGVAEVGKFLEVPKEKWERLMQINLMAPMRLVYSFLPAMLERGSGHVVNISSLAGRVGPGLLSSYAASKFGLRGFGEALSVELDGTGVSVTNIYPAFTRTNIIHSERHGEGAAGLDVPDFAMGEPEDVAADIISGIKDNTLHVYPGIASKSVDFLNRLSPALTRFMQTAPFQSLLGKK